MDWFRLALSTSFQRGGISPLEANENRRSLVKTEKFGHFLSGFLSVEPPSQWPLSSSGDGRLYQGLLFVPLPLSDAIEGLFLWLSAMVAALEAGRLDQIIEAQGHLAELMGQEAAHRDLLALPLRARDLAKP